MTKLDEGAEAGAPGSVRQRLEAMSRAVGTDPNGRLPPPPYHLYGVDLLYFRCRFDPEAARAALPPQFENDDDFTGTLMIFAARDSMAFGAHGSGYVALSVKGFNAPDDDYAMCILADFRSGRGGDAIRAFFTSASQKGLSRIVEDGDTISGEAGPGAPAMRLSGRLTGSRGDKLAMVSHYLGANPAANGYNFWTVHGAARLHELADARAELLEGLAEPLRRLKPIEVLWPLLVEDMSLTISTPQPIDLASRTLAARSVRNELLDVFSLLGRPAVIVGRGGRVLHANQQVGEIAGSGLNFSDGTIGVRSASARAALLSAIDISIGTGAMAEPVALPRGPGLAPMLAQTMPLAAAAAGEPAALILLYDPGQPQRIEAVPALRLLGLTPAEARLAAIIGDGIAPREAASTLSISEGTARTTLKTVFRKLSISRQAELAQLVARLAG